MSKRLRTMYQCTDCKGTGIKHDMSECLCCDGKGVHVGIE